MNLSIRLSKLVAGRLNPRRVRPERDAHKRLVASIRAFGLLEPLLVAKGENGTYPVIAGNRRLAALREVHRGEDLKIDCILKDVDGDRAASMSLAENFVREPMHPADEAFAFARLARKDGKNVAVIASEFGVSETYVRQRMKLATLAAPVLSALRSGGINLSVAEAFAAVPVDRQEELWNQTGGHPRHAQHVRNLIEHAWIAASHAMFDIAAIEASSISHDLFGGSLLIERTAFMRAQAEAIEAERTRLTEEGWKEAVVCERSEVQDRLYAMDEAEPQYDPATTAKLARLQERREKIEAREIETEEDDKRITEALAKLNEREQEIIKGKTASYPEEVKARGTAFLILSPDGRVERHYRLPRGKKNTNPQQAGGNVGPAEPDAPPTADDLSDRQRAAIHMHEAVAVREAAFKDKLTRKRLLVLALHDKVRNDGLAVRADANATRLYAEQNETFRSTEWEAQQARRGEIDPFISEPYVDEAEAYRRLKDLSEKQLDALIAVLIVESITGHGHRQTPLIALLAEELGMTLRSHWTPDEHWLSGYRKLQLADLTTTLKGPAYGPSALQRKKSELVDDLAALFSQAASAANGFEDKSLAERVNKWLPRREAA